MSTESAMFRKDRRKIEYSRHNVRYLVVHTTGTKPDMPLTDLDGMPYHYLITKAGKLLSLKPVGAKDGTIEIALVGGLDKEGNRTDCRTARQSETLFNTLVKLCDQFPRARINAADQLYVYAFPNPGFDLQGWIRGYVPDFLKVAA